MTNENKDRLEEARYVVEANSGLSRVMINTSFKLFKWLIDEVDRLSRQSKFNHGITKDYNAKLSKQIESLTAENEELRKWVDPLGPQKVKDLTKERDEFEGIINRYEDAQGLGIQAIISRNEDLTGKIEQLWELIPHKQKIGNQRLKPLTQKEPK